jgi:lipoprotein-anchoring transpeptidase ErfK/SrfK
MKQIVGVLLFQLFGAAHALAAPGLLARIDIPSQTMEVYENGVLTYSWPVSTARRGYHTPVGSYRPFRLERMWYSSQYENSPMPHSVFFRGGYAIHGTEAIRSLGRPASHGCIRLDPEDAATFYDLVAANGLRDTRIVVTDASTGAVRRAAPIGEMRAAEDDSDWSWW